MTSSAEGELVETWEVCLGQIRHTQIPFANDNMLPRFPNHNVSCRCSCNSESFAKLFPVKSSKVKLSNLTDTFWIQLCQVMPLSVLHSSFFGGILKIVLGRSNPEVARIDTLRIVTRRAIMKNMETIWNWPIVQNPASSMRRYSFAGIPPLNNAAVSTARYICYPDPTPISLLHFLPKAFWKVLRKSLRSKVLLGNLLHSRLSFAAWVTGPAAFSFSHRIG